MGRVSGVPLRTPRSREQGCFCGIEWGELILEEREIAPSSEDPVSSLSPSWTASKLNGCSSKLFSKHRAAQHPMSIF